MAHSCRFIFPHAWSSLGTGARGCHSGKGPRSPRVVPCSSPMTDTADEHTRSTPDPGGSFQFPPSAVLQVLGMKFKESQPTSWFILPVNEGQ